jgi:hypothetical protein
MSPEPHVLICGTERWRHYHVIRNNSVTIIDMEPALWAGWTSVGFGAKGITTGAECRRIRFSRSSSRAAVTGFIG